LSEAVWELYHPATIAFTIILHETIAITVVLFFPNVFL
jgi:hypothetical protein